MNETLLLAGTGLVFCVATVPYACGRRHNQGGITWWLLGGVFGYWMLFVAGATFLAVLRYKNAWMDLLKFKTEERIRAIEADHASRWKYADDATKVTCGYERQTQRLQDRVRVLQKKVDRLDSLLEEQTRKGYW
jgi:hypothetical protein